MIAEDKKYDVQLTEPDQVVSQYLQALLSDVDEYQEPVETASVLQVQQEVKVETQAAEDISVPDATAVELSEKEEQQEEVQPVIPEWAEGRFQCLFFEIHGLQLGVPLCALSGIATGDAEITHLMGQPDWHKGLMEYRGNKVGVVDISGLVMPERGDDKPQGDNKPSHILIVGDGKWGLMCDKLLSPTNLEPSEVHWSCRHKNRPWMAGTLPDQLCILLDIDVLLTIFEPKKTAPLKNQA